MTFEVIKNLLENSNSSKEVVVDIYLHIVETENDYKIKTHTIRKIISNLFETQEERIGYYSDDNMSTVRVKMVERKDLEANLLLKAPDNKQTKSDSTVDLILAVEKPASIKTLANFGSKAKQSYSRSSM